MCFTYMHNNVLHIKKKYIYIYNLNSNTFSVTHPLIFSVCCLHTSSTTIMQITVKLDLRKNDLQELPKGAFHHTPYLTHLNLQGSNIRSVREGAFRGLGRLVFLNLAHNNIDVLYQVILLMVLHRFVQRKIESI